MSMGEIFDKAIRIYKANFRVLIAAFAVVYIPVMAARVLVETLVITPYFMDQFDLSNFGFGFYLQILLFDLPRNMQVLIVVALTSIPLTKISISFMKGESMSVREAYKGVSRTWRRLIGAYLLLAVILIALLLWTVVPIAGWFSGPGMFLILFFVASQMLGVILILEGCGAREAVRRAWRLSRARFWWIFAFATASFLFKKWVAAGLFALSEFLFFSFLASTSAMSGPMGFTIFKALQTFLNMISDMLTLPIAMIVIILLYLDLRVRLEGLDLQVRASSTFEALPAEKSTNRLTRRDWVNMAWVSIILLGVFAFIYYYPDESGVAIFMSSFLFP